jgi:ATP-dependent DNA ligase
MTQDFIFAQDGILDPDTAKIFAVVRNGGVWRAIWRKNHDEQDLQGRLAGRVGTGMSEKALKNLRCRLDPLARPKSPLNVPPPRSTRFGSPLVLCRVHWVQPKLVAEITYLTWRQPVAADGLCRAAGG